MFDDLRFRLRPFFHRKTVESALDEDFRAPHENEIAKYVAAGVPPVEAARRARLALGGLEQTKEQCRQSRGTHLLETVVQDVRYALRTLRRTPGFTAVALLTLALGIGANTAIFSFVDGVLLNPLPYPDADRIVRVMERPPRDERNGISTFNFLAWQKDNTVFDFLAGQGPGAATLTGLSEPVQLRGARVSS